MEHYGQGTCNAYKSRKSAKAYHSGKNEWKEKEKCPG